MFRSLAEFAPEVVVGIAIVVVIVAMTLAILGF